MPSSSDSHQRGASPARRKQSDINDDKNTCLYIGNIDKKLNNEQLTQIFKKYGELQYCYLIYEPSSSDRNSKEIKVSRGYGFAKFVKMEHLMTAKNQLDGYQVNGRKIKVQISKRNKPRQETPGRYLGKKRQSPQHRRYRSRSSSYSNYQRRRHHQKKQKHKKKKEKQRQRERERDRSRQQRQRSRSRDRNGEYRRRKRSYSNDRQRRREKQ